LAALAGLLLATLVLLIGLLAALMLLIGLLAALMLLIRLLAAALLLAGVLVLHVLGIVLVGHSRLLEGFAICPRPVTSTPRDEKSSPAARINRRRLRLDFATTCTDFVQQPAISIGAFS
jgi:hypothetical protein